MAHRPVCVKCEVEMRAEKNGVIVVDIEHETVTQFWSADLWRCPKCDAEIVIGFVPSAIRFGDKTKHDFLKRAARCIADGHAYLCAR